MPGTLAARTHRANSLTQLNIAFWARGEKSLLAGSAMRRSMFVSINHFDLPVRMLGWDSIRSNAHALSKGKTPEKRVGNSDLRMKPEEHHRTNNAIGTKGPCED